MKASNFKIRDLKFWAWTQTSAMFGHWWKCLRHKSLSRFIESLCSGMKWVWPKRPSSWRLCSWSESAFLPLTCWVYWFPWIPMRARRWRGASIIRLRSAHFTASGSKATWILRWPLFYHCEAPLPSTRPHTSDTFASLCGRDFSKSPPLWGPNPRLFSSSLINSAGLRIPDKRCPIRRRFFRRLRLSCCCQKDLEDIGRVSNQSERSVRDAFWIKLNSIEFNSCFL